jgi:hypothetical protein
LISKPDMDDSKFVQSFEAPRWIRKTE